MADGKVHGQTTVRAAKVLTFSGILIYFATHLSAIHSAVAGFAIAFGCYCGLYLSPDLDTISRPYKRWGILRFYWYPYRKLIPHRNILSHGIFLSTAIRILYASPIIYFCFWPVIPDIIFWALWALGLAISDILHLLKDGILI